MNKIFRSFVGLTTALALTVTARGGDPTGVDSGDELTSAEVAAVLATSGSAFDSVGIAAQIAAQEVLASDVAQGAPAEAPISVNESFDVSVPCESGGRRPLAGRPEGGGLAWLGGRPLGRTAASFG
jgi:hypothetical protein